LRIIPNADHPLIGSQNTAIDATSAWIYTFVDQTISRPSYSWEIDGYTVTVMATAENLVGARAWYSRSTIRDWRMVRCPRADCANPQAFASSIDIQPIGSNGPYLIFQHTMEQPGGRPYRYAAHLIELTYNVGSPTNPEYFVVTSDLSIVSMNLDIPYPYPPCSPDICACGASCVNQSKALILG
jgi:hypothetical protein